jgi:hypothetical protein
VRRRSRGWCGRACPKVRRQLRCPSVAEDLLSLEGQGLRACHSLPLAPMLYDLHAHRCKGKPQCAIRARREGQVLCLVAESDHGPGIQRCSSANCVPLPSHVPSYRTMWTDSLMFSRASHALDSCWQADQEAKRYVEQTREEADPKPYNQSGPIRLRIGSRAVTRRPYPKGEPPNHYGPCRLRHSYPLAYDHENAPALGPGQDPKRCFRIYESSRTKVTSMFTL